MRAALAAAALLALTAAGSRWAWLSSHRLAEALPRPERARFSSTWLDVDGNEVSVRVQKQAAAPAARPRRPSPAHAFADARCRPSPQIHAHGGQLLEHDGLYFWVGTSRKVRLEARERACPPTPPERRALLSPHTQVAPWWISWAINLYSSDDLVRWHYWCARQTNKQALWWWVSRVCTHVTPRPPPSRSGVIFSQKQALDFPGAARPYGHLNQPPPPLRMERPKLLHHRRGGYFVLFFHLDTPSFEAPAVGVATSAAITGGRGGGRVWPGGWVVGGGVGLGGRVCACARHPGHALEQLLPRPRAL